MMKTRYETDDLRISSIDDVATPKTILDEFPLTGSTSMHISSTREDIHRILHGEDDRLLAIVGPCSIHDPDAARDYANRLLEYRHRLADQLLIVMRVYFEKPRTTIGWKGLINDPDLDGNFNIDKGLRIARRLLRDLNDSGMPAGVEFLDLITPQYVADLISWGAIGARTTESQVHREMASGLSCPVGFKNGTDGNIKIAVDAVGASRHPHAFLSFTKEGRAAIFKTTGNDDAHIILRGGKSPNYEAGHVGEAAEQLKKSGHPPRLMIDFSHANSAKQYQRQVLVGRDVAGQIADGQQAVMGVMIESNLVAGRQDNVEGQALVYGQSITDACLGWEDTTKVLEDLSEAVIRRRRGSA
ncbi:3-deoxy-7-phosphoheptulonate synthase AroG [Thioalkalivibrio sp. HK1]|uniref:3-deoxy-7-phosphoheptulonate synthase AroG n=1 Tax=Thioalkalivibrio sp. HK1 TaxID=1469245 RepID=UPI0027D31BAB|nr:3-deoxy-7-phosphoheptulonate synthase AroG [Thioalkalivibrio sp. HK1]